MGNTRLCNRHRWILGIQVATIIAMLALAFLNVSGRIPDWSYWTAFGIYMAVQTALYVIRWHVLPARDKTRDDRA